VVWKKKNGSKEMERTSVWTSLFVFPISFVSVLPLNSACGSLVALSASHGAGKSESNTIGTFFSGSGVNSSLAREDNPLYYRVI